jgi:hypothetical protein
MKMRQGWLGHSYGSSTTPGTARPLSVDFFGAEGCPLGEVKILSDESERWRFDAAAAACLSETEGGLGASTEHPGRQVRKVQVSCGVFGNQGWANLRGLRELRRRPSETTGGGTGDEKMRPGEGNSGLLSRSEGGRDERMLVLERGPSRTIGGSRNSDSCDPYISLGVLGTRISAAGVDVAMSPNDGVETGGNFVAAMNAEVGESWRAA